MFTGNQEISLKCNLTEEQFDEKVELALERLGKIKIRSNGEIDIRPRSSLNSFWSNVTMSGKIRQKNGKYRVTVDYSLSPTPGLIAIAVVLFCVVLVVGVVAILAPLLIDKPIIDTAIQNAFQDLEDSLEEVDGD